MTKHDVCFVGLENLPVLAKEFNHHGIGGEQVQQTLLGLALVNRGYKVSMVVGDYGQADGAIWEEIATYKAYRFDEGLPVLRFVHPRWTGLWRALKRANATTYYVSCAGMQVGLVAIFCRAHGRRFVFRAASDTDCQPKNLLIQYRRDKKLYEFGLRRATAILTQSKKQQVDLRTNYGLPSHVAGMLVDTPTHTLSLMERDIDVLWINNLRQLKRPEKFIELARRMPNRRFVMIGGSQAGAAKLFEEVKQFAASIPNLSFLGRVPYHDVNDFYAKARVFVNTSDIEGFPNSYLQAWARGTPLVAFFDPDGVIKRAGLGIVPDTIEEMVQAAERLLADDSTWRQTNERCLAFMAQNYGDDHILRPYLAALGLDKGS